MRNALLALVLVAACGGSSTSSSSGSTSGGNGSTPPPSSELCGSVACGEDEHCDHREVQCVRAPCERVPTCVAGMHPCAATMCTADSRCEARDGVAVCIPLAAETGGVPCGRATCAEGMVCCNASCGVCTPPDGMCTQQFCGE